MILGNWSTGSLPVLSEACICSRVTTLEGIPALRAQKRPQHPCWESLLRIGSDSPGATGRGGREATYDGHSLGRIYGPILDRLPWSVRKILRHLVNIGRGGAPLRRPAARLQALIPLR